MNEDFMGKINEIMGASGKIHGEFMAFGVYPYSALPIYVWGICGAITRVLGESDHRYLSTFATSTKVC